MISKILPKTTLCSVLAANSEPQDNMGQNECFTDYKNTALAKSREFISVASPVDLSKAVALHQKIAGEMKRSLIKKLDPKKEGK